MERFLYRSTTALGIQAEMHQRQLLAEAESRRVAPRPAAVWILGIALPPLLRSRK